MGQMKRFLTLCLIDNLGILELPYVQEKAYLSLKAGAVWLKRLCDPVTAQLTNRLMHLVDYPSPSIRSSVKSSV